MVKVTETEKDKRFCVPGKVKVISGSVLNPENAGLRFILNLANMVGNTENPIYSLFDKKWKKVKQEVRGWYANKNGAYKLGEINTTAVQSDVWVINMLCQSDKLEAQRPAVQQCLKKVAESAKYEKASVHVSTLLTDQVPTLKDDLNKFVVEQGVSVYYYTE